MAYTPVNWQTGDTITAERLNRMDRGWGVDSTQLFSETVTTVDQGGTNFATLAYANMVDASTIMVTFDGTEYTCPLIDIGGSHFYGGFSEQGPTFTEYPFAISSSGSNGNFLMTQTAGEHTIAVAALSLQTSADFAAAVNMANPIDLSTLPLRCMEGVTTYDEAVSAMKGGRLVYFTANDETFETTPKCFMVNAVGRTCTIVPTSTKIAAKFGPDDGLFYIEHLSS